MDLRGRAALVTGAGQRVGRAIALALAARGMKVAVHYHGSEAGARETAELAARAGGDGWTVRADLRRAEEAERVVRDAAAHFGTLDVLVKSAAVMVRTPVAEVTPAQWDDMMAINLRAPFFCARAAAAVMGARGGAIVNIADLAAFERWAGYPVHVLSKSGVVVLTELLARALAPRIRVNAVAPGAVLPPDDWTAEARERLVATTPLRRLGAPADVAAAVVYLLENDFVTGETLVVDGGRRIR